ncbi:threonine/serine exporter family protein [Anaerobacillus sp. MEB173]|uniref:threonine/serine exporter family protein n=1 Tax=Anaerobacillus sp. MEB173 TaxID=3383345 RepID=UPI003F92B85A
MWLEILFVFIATIAFGILFNVPTTAILFGSIAGTIGFTFLRLLPAYGVTTIFATVVASFFVAMMSHFLAKKFRAPVTIFIIPGIIPLVPGSKAYFTMLAFVEGNYLGGLELGIETMLQAGAIAAGLVFALSIYSFGKGIGLRYEPNR